MQPVTCIEVASGRKVIVKSGADARDGLVVYRYADDVQKHTITREAFFLNGYFVACDPSYTPQGTSMSVKFKVFKGKDGQHYARMTAGNGRITWQSEGYVRLAGAHNVCASTWSNIGKSLNVIRDLPPVPYAKGSLLPRVLS